MENRGQTDRVTTPTRAELRPTAAGLGCTTPHASPRKRAAHDVTTVDALLRHAVSQCSTLNLDLDL